MALLTVIKNGHETKVKFEGTPLLSEVLEKNGYYVPHPCGKRGICGKCAVSVGGSVSDPDPVEVRAGCRLSCRVRLYGNSAVILPADSEAKIEKGFGPEIISEEKRGKYSAAADIGTTTVAVRLYESESGKCVAAKGCINPQTAIAADVIGRIDDAMKNGSEKQEKMIKSCLEKLYSECLSEIGCPGGKIEKAVITGNTAMLYMLTGKNPESLSRAPFEADCLFGMTETVAGIPSYLPPCFHAYAGADILCGIMHSEMTGKEETSLFCDIGTNGEIALYHNGHLYVTSTAAGPAFEGAGIACGMGAEEGAVDRVEITGNTVGIHTIGEKPAKGICGSGLIDAAACFLRIGLMDETGALEKERISLENGVYITQKDIRNLQLAKSAVAAGTKALLTSAGCSEKDIAALYLAGGFGSRLNPVNAGYIGLIPKCLVHKTKVLGNSAVMGAGEILTGKRTKKEEEKIMSLATYINLGGDPLFGKLYMENMIFGTEEKC